VSTTAYELDAFMLARAKLKHSPYIHHYGHEYGYK